MSALLTSALRSEIAAGIDECLADWNEGRSTSPDARDYVFVADKILVERGVEFEIVVETVADELDAWMTEATPESTQAIAAWLIGRLLPESGFEADLEEAAESYAETASFTLLCAGAIPVEIDVENIAEEALEAAFKRVHDLVREAGFSATGDVMPGELLGLERAFATIVRSVCANITGRIGDESAARPETAREAATVDEVERLESDDPRLIAALREHVTENASAMHTGGGCMVARVPVPQAVDGDVETDVNPGREVWLTREDDGPTNSWLLGFYDYAADDCDEGVCVWLDVKDPNSADEVAKYVGSILGRLGFPVNAKVEA